MPGTKNHSGRYPKGWSDWDIDKVVNHSVKLVARFLNDESIDKVKRMEVAAKFACKVIPEQTFVEHRHSISHEDRLLLRERLSKVVGDRLPHKKVETVDAERLDDES